MDRIFALKNMTPTLLAILRFYELMLFFLSIVHVSNMIYGQFSSMFAIELAPGYLQ